MELDVPIDDSGDRFQYRAAWIRLLPELTAGELHQLQQQILLRLWRNRFRLLRRLPAAVKLGLTYSSLAFLAIMLIPLPADQPLFVPLLIAATGSVAVTLVAVFDLVVGLVLVRFTPQVPAFDDFWAGDGLNNLSQPYTISSVQGTQP